MSDSPKVGRPAIGEPINVRLGAENLAWLDRLAALNDATRADVLRGVVTAAREASVQPVRTLPYHAQSTVDQLGQHAPEDVKAFNSCSAAWSAHMQAGNDYAKQVRKVEADADAEADARNAPASEPWPAEVYARIVALQGARDASFEAAAEEEANIASIVASIVQDAREAGADVEAVIAD